LSADIQAASGDRNARVLALRPSKDGLTSAPRQPLYQYSEGGVVRADMLADNIGYLRIEGFQIGFQQAIDRIMPKLNGTRALINHGRSKGRGRSQHILYPLSYFTEPAKPPPIAYFHTRKPGTAEIETATQMPVTTPLSLSGKQVLVLTSRRTSCSGEEFAFD